MASESCQQSENLHRPESLVLIEEKICRDKAFNMARMTFVLLLVLVAVCATMASKAPKPKPKPEPKCCGKNEIWKDCGNACREPKCGRSQKKIACTAICEQRCECKKGYLRNTNGKCVEPCDC